MTDDKPPADIELATTPELIAELKKRCDRLLLVYHTPRDVLAMEWRGYTTDAIGLADYARKRAFQILLESQPGEMGEG